LQTEPRAVAEIGNQLLGKMVQVGDNLRDPVTLEQLENDLHDRAIDYRHKRFWHACCQRIQTGAHAGCQYHCFHHYSSDCLNRIPGSLYLYTFQLPDAQPLSGSIGKTVAVRRQRLTSTL